jgi:hypothetical protein
MKRAFLHRRDLAVIVVLALAAIGQALNRSGLETTLCSVTLLTIAVFKARLVVLDYLGLRSAPGPWRAILTTWIVALALVSAASSLIGLLS